MSESAVRLCIAGGGTGGHVFPALALADAVRRRWPRVEVSFVGAARGLEARLLPERGEKMLLLTMHSVQGAGLWQKLRVLAWELPRAVWRIRRDWRRARPHLVVGVGGYASVAGVLAGLLQRIPVVLYEQNAVAGMVNRELTPFCRSIMLGFADAAAGLPNARTEYTGNLVAASIRRLQWRAHEPPCLLVLGGSQGARVLNHLLPDACRILRENGRGFVVRHVAGAGDRVAALQQRYAEAGVEAMVVGFCEEMPAWYAEADLLLARAGAMTVCEAAAVGLPAVFVPLPHAADDHQRRNAEAVARQGGAVVLAEAELTPASLAGRLADLLFDQSRLRKMSAAARQALPRDSEQRMLDVLGSWLEAAA